MSYTASVADLFEAIAPADCWSLGYGDAPVVSVTADSRTIKPGCLFVAIRGAKADGHSFIEQAVKLGACAVVVEQGACEPARCQQLGVPVAAVRSSRLALAQIADDFYGRPSSSLETYGVTGTNGKTSTTWLIANMLAALGAPCGIIGTLGTYLVRNPSETDRFTETSNTSPDPLVAQRYMHELVSNWAQGVAIEVTSQGVAQERTSSIAWDCAIFTNLTRDHLDLHGTIEEYGELKQRLFTDLLVRSDKPDRIAVLNVDDPFGQSVYNLLHAEHPQIRTVGYSANGGHTEYFARSSRCTLSGTEIEAVLNGQPVMLNSQLLGRYNVANILAAVSALHALGYNASELVRALPAVPCVPGRLEAVGTPKLQVFVDYAHTPDALVNVQHSLRELTPGRLITVFGCGGDRDRGKRPLMGQAVAKWSDVAVVTSDNPRTEDPDLIIEDILPGLENEAAQKPAFSWQKITGRKQAIEKAIELARPGDVVLVAGKGHEDYQEIQGVKHHFLDAEVCRAALSERTTKARL